MSFVSIKALESPPPARPAKGAPAESVQLGIEGMHCASCVTRVEQALASVEAVTAASVNLATERAHVTLARPVPAETLVAAVRRAGYDAHALTGSGIDAAAEAARDAARADLTRRLTIAAALTAPIVVLGNFGMWPPLDRVPLTVQNWIQFGLAMVAQFLDGAPFILGGLACVALGARDIDLHVGLGT